MKTKILALSAGLLIVIVVLIVAGCGGGGTTTSSSSGGTTSSSSGGGLYGGGATTTMSMASTTTGAATSSSAATGAGAKVSLKNLAITPTSVTVDADHSVTWTNNDSVTHHLVGNKGEFDSGDMAPGATYTFTFKTSGNVNYHCSIHPSMTGVVVVK